MSGFTTRRSLMSGLAAAALVASAGAARAQFEGTVTMHVNNNGHGGSDMLWSVKGDKARMDINGESMPMYMIRQGDQATIVMPSQKMYIAETLPSNVPETRDGKIHGDFQFTGRKETIAGYECEHVITTDEKGEKTDICLAKGLGTFMMPTNPMARGRGGQGPSGQVAAILKKLDGAVFPLKVQRVGENTPELLVTKIEKKSLDESMFKMPSDYRKFDIGAMMGRPPAI